MRTSPYDLGRKSQFSSNDAKKIAKFVKWLQENKIRQKFVKIRLKIRQMVLKRNLQSSLNGLGKNRETFQTIAKKSRNSNNDCGRKSLNK